MKWLINYLIVVLLCFYCVRAKWRKREKALGRESPVSYLNAPGSNGAVNFSNSFDQNCGRPNDYFYMNPASFLHPSIASPSSLIHGAINGGTVENQIWPQFNLSHAPLSSSPLYASQPSSLSKQIPNPWSSALFSAYMLHFWPGSGSGSGSAATNSLPNGSLSGRLSPNATHSLKLSHNSLGPSSSSSHFHPLSLQHQQSMLEILRQKAQHQLSSPSLSESESERILNKEKCIHERQSSPNKA